MFQIFYFYYPIAHYDNFYFLFYPIQNCLELAEAIRELQESTAALTSDSVSQASRTSLQCSSGYGTMNSTPSGSEDTIASGGKSSQTS